MKQTVEEITAEALELLRQNYAEGLHPRDALRREIARAMPELHPWEIGAGMKRLDEDMQKIMEKIRIP